MAPYVYFVDRSEMFRTVASEIEQKYIRRHNERPGVTLRHENRPSTTFINISTSIVPIVNEMYSFRKMLSEKSQDYIFATPSYSCMSQEEREELDEALLTFLPQFNALINQLGNRISNSDGLRHVTERLHLQRVHEGLKTYLKETTEFTAFLKREHLTRLQSKNRSLTNRIKAAQKAGHVFKYFSGIEEMAADPSLNINSALVSQLQELCSKHECLTFTPKNQSPESDMGKDYEVVEDIENIVESGWDDDWETVDDEKTTRITPDNNSKVLQESLGVRNRKKMTMMDGEHGNRDDYERWKAEQGSEFEERFQKQTALLKKEFVHSEQDDEIMKLEEQICEIQSLSSVFSEKIMDQERDIDLINDLALHTTENLADGNEWIRKAITNSALRRVILLFCIIVLTFTLLFLDWYNP